VNCSRSINREYKSKYMRKDTCPEMVEEDTIIRGELLADKAEKELRGEDVI